MIRQHVSVKSRWFVSLTRIGIVLVTTATIRSETFFVMIDRGCAWSEYGMVIPVDLNSNTDFVGWRHPNDDFVTRAVSWGPSQGLQDMHPDGYDTSSVMSVNNTGQIVGSAWQEYMGARAFLWIDRIATDLHPLIGPDTIESWANDINNSGQIVGGKGASFFHVFLLDGQEAVDIHDLGAESESRAINDAG